MTAIETVVTSPQLSLLCRSLYDQENRPADPSYKGMYFFHKKDTM